MLSSWRKAPAQDRLVNAVHVVPNPEFGGSMPNEYESVKFSVIGGSQIQVPMEVGMTVGELCDRQGQDVTGMQATVNGRRVDLTHRLEGGESVMIVQKVTGN